MLGNRLKRTHFDHNNERVQWTVGTSTDSHHAGARPGPTRTSWGAVCVEFLHLTGRPQSKHFWFHQVILSHLTKQAYVVTCNSITRTSVLDSRLKRTHFDHNDLSALDTRNEYRQPSRRRSAWAFLLPSLPRPSILHHSSTSIPCQTTPYRTSMCPHP